MLVYAEPFQKKYEAPIASSAGCFFVFCLLIMLIIPLIISYTFGGFWLKQSVFREQPLVQYKKDLIVNLYGDDTVITWSSNPVYNKFRIATLAQPSVLTSDVDVNHDGLIDWTDFSISVPLELTDSIKNVQVAFFLQYQLSSVINLQMETLAVLNMQTGVSASSLHATGYLKFRQYKAIPYWTDRTVYNQPIVNWTAAANDPSLSSWTSLIDNYMDRSDGTTFIVDYPVWKGNRGANEPFVITGRIRYIEDEIVYMPGGLELFKWAWIQYLSFFLIVSAIVLTVMGAVYRQQILQTFLRTDRVPSTNGPSYSRLTGMNDAPHISGKTFKQYNF